MLKLYCQGYFLKLLCSKHYVYKNMFYNISTFIKQENLYSNTNNLQFPFLVH